MSEVVRTCSKCGGTGKYPFMATNALSGVGLTTSIRLAMTCYRCDGTGKLVYDFDQQTGKTGEHR